MLIDKKYIAEDFKTEVFCYFKNWNGGMYDIYMFDKCIVQGVSIKDFEELKRILKLR